MKNPRAAAKTEQTGSVVWFTGLPASGKSTLARRVRDALVARGDACCLLDGDEVRARLTPAPGYDPEARRDFYATLAGFAALLAEQGLVVLVPATAHLREFRERARRLAPRFIEVYVDVALEVCRARDPKGLYRAATSDEASELPGAQRPYEPPESPHVVVTDALADASVARVLAALDA